MASLTESHIQSQTSRSSQSREFLRKKVGLVSKYTKDEIKNYYRKIKRNNNDNMKDKNEKMIEIQIDEVTDVMSENSKKQEDDKKDASRKSCPT